MQRRRSTHPVPVPGSRATLPGLAGTHVLQAASLDGEKILWTAVSDLPCLPTSPKYMVALQGILEDCLAYEPKSRPKLSELLQDLRFVS